MNTLKTLIAIPCMDMVPSLFAQSLTSLKKVGDCAVAFQMGSLVYTSRNELAKYAIKNDFDYVLWLDSDMVIEPDTMERMIKTMLKQDIDMLTGVYFRRTAPYTPVLFDKLRPTNRGWDWTEFNELPEKGLFEVGGCGFGCVCMSTEVLMSVQGKHGYLFHPMNNGGEDISFCWRVWDCGYKIMCDPEIQCGHVGYAVFNGAYWCSMKKDGGAE